MTGPEHYAEAERLVREADQIAMTFVNGVGGGQYPASEALVAVNAKYTDAQVHATLAQVAATMDLTGATVNGIVTPGWRDVLGREQS